MNKCWTKLKIVNYDLPLLLPFDSSSGSLDLDLGLTNDGVGIDRIF